MGDRSGQQFGNYRLIRLLGKGGFAEVYLGTHLYIKRQAAIKLLRTTLGQKQRNNFLAEAQRLVDVAHPHIIRMLDFAVEDDIPFLVMEYAPNGSLRNKHPWGSQLALETILVYVKQAADALQYIHDQKLVHRDIKPENMLLDAQHKLLLSDFGIASIAHDTGSLDQQGHSGTPPYMAPEQIQGKPRPASDQYALGTVVYEWLRGSLPFQGSISEIIAQNLFAPPAPLRETIPTLPHAVEDVVLKALAKDPKNRFESIQVFAHNLEQACQENLLLRSTELPEEVRAADLTPNPLSTPERASLTIQLNTDRETILAEASSPSVTTNLIVDKLVATDLSIQLSGDTPSQNGFLTPQLTTNLLTPSAETQTDQQTRKRSLPRRTLLVGALALLAGGGAIAYTLMETGKAGNGGIQGAISGQRSRLQSGQTPVPPSVRNASSSRSTSSSPSSSSSARSTSGAPVQRRSTPGIQPTATTGSPAQSAPGVQASPTAAGNLNPTPTQAAVAPPLTLQITGIPSQVHNNTDIPVTVTANAEGVGVQLIVTYNLLADIFNSTSQATSSNGQAVLNWHVGLLTTLTGLIAHVTAVAKDQNGQQIKSPTVNVTVLSSLLG